MVGAIDCWLVGWFARGSRSDSVHSCARAWPALRGTCCHAFPFRDPRVRSIQLWVCMDLPLTSVAGCAGCWARCMVFFGCGLSILPTSPLSAAAAALAAVCFGQSFLPRSPVVPAGGPLTRSELVGRMVAGA